MKWFIDGSGWNGKVSKWCVTNENGKIFKEELDKKFTNNQMEYLALLKCLIMAKPGDEIFTDSQLLVGHTRKGWKVNVDHLKGPVETAKKLLNGKRIKLTWIPRNQNKAGKILEKKRN